MEQAAKRDNMTQQEIDDLAMLLERGEFSPEPETSESSEFSLALKKKIRDNYRQLEYAIKRCEVESLANVRNEERPARLAQVHHYAHWNWLLKRGFNDKRDFRAFMDRKAKERGVTLNWGGKP